ncbi:hypothetical protein [Rummeliibacillus pycnus]|uniref:hypothetical protein n=1 Tax=Rummeliibacillus pycnus TaxID=101070 RepID=UPI003D282C98
MNINSVEVLEEYTTYIRDLPSGLKKILNNIEMENYEVVPHQILLLTEGMEWLLSANQYLISNNTVSENVIEVLNPHLESLLNGLGKKDYVLISDIVEYELIPYFEELKELN